MLEILTRTVSYVRKRTWVHGVCSGGRRTGLAPSGGCYCCVTAATVCVFIDEKIGKKNPGAFCAFTCAFSVVVSRCARIILCVGRAHARPSRAKIRRTFAAFPVVRPPDDTSCPVSIRMRASVSYLYYVYIYIYIRTFFRPFPMIFLQGKKNKEPFASPARGDTITR